MPRPSRMVAQIRPPRALLVLVDLDPALAGGARPRSGISRRRGPSAGTPRRKSFTISSVCTCPREFLYLISTSSRTLLLAATSLQPMASSASSLALHLSPFPPKFPIWSERDGHDHMCRHCRGRLFVVVDGMRGGAAVAGGGAGRRKQQS
ncbi:hypothetical protein ACQJBY_071939 [Aegilops geniculata]